MFYKSGVTRRHYQPCPPEVHEAALTSDEVWASWPLVGRSPDLGIETRRCPTCQSTRSRPLADDAAVAA